MSRITMKGPSPRRGTADPLGEADPSNSSQATQDLESRDQFYRDYREAVRAMRRGDPERFIAYQSDPRIRPRPEPLHLPPRPVTQESPVGSKVLAVPAMAEAQFSVISLLSSVREMVTVLGKLLS